MKVFLPFRLDTLNYCLWRAGERVRLTPKAFDVLRYLVDHANRLVTQDEILETLWHDTYVNPEVVKKYVLEIRKVLGDQSDNPAFVATFPRRGYQFIAPVREESATSHSATGPAKAIVGREAAFDQLDAYLSDTVNAQRQVIFVTGEAGIGKTSLVDMFHQRAAFRSNLRIARGQCIEGFGGKEAYYPVLEALGQLIRNTEDSPIIQALLARAPTWIIQFPGLVKSEVREALQRETIGSTRDRMVREICEALEAITAEDPLILILEDLHWADSSTLDFISALARRRGPAKLLLLATYRPADVVISQSPLKGLKHDLLLHHLCQEISLESLESKDVAQYIALKFPDAQFSPGLSDLVYHQSAGNALFMVAIVQEIVKKGLIAQDHGTWKLTRPLEDIEPIVPETLQQMLAIQFDQLNAAQQSLLKAASVAGDRFSVCAVTPALDIDPEQIEAICEELVEKQQFLHSAGVQELPNGEFSTRFEFRHALYRQGIYKRLNVSFRSKLHLSIGEREEEMFGERSSEIAAELATHFELGRDYKRAAKYFQQAADNAIRRFAYQESVELSRRGLDLLGKLPDTEERAVQELCLQLALGVPLIATEGYAAPSVGIVYQRARELCQQLGDTPDVSEVLWGLWTFHTLRADLKIALQIAEEFLHLSARLPYPGLAMRGYWALEITFMHLGDFAISMANFEKAMALCMPERHLDDAVFYAQNPRVAMPSFAAWSLWFLGRPDQALACIEEALSLARELSEPHGLAHALFCAAILHQLRGEKQIAHVHATETIVISRKHGFVLYEAMATITQAWASADQERQEVSIEQLRRGLASHQATGTEVLLPHFSALLVERLLSTSKPEEGFRVLEEVQAKVAHNGECYYQAELFRLKGELLLARLPNLGASKGSKTAAGVEQNSIAEAEYCFNQSISIARRQQGKSLELRSTMSLARLYRRQSKRQEAREMLAQVYDWFTEGFATFDLLEAKALLKELS
jgi:DNA-binding winged helix-turn-helix (wHTH) protein/predicted ATPase